MKEKQSYQKIKRKRIGAALLALVLVITLCSTASGEVQAAAATKKKTTAASTASKTAATAKKTTGTSSTAKKKTTAKTTAASAASKKKASEAADVKTTDLEQSKEKNPAVKEAEQTYYTVTTETSLPGQARVELYVKDERQVKDNKSQEISEENKNRLEKGKEGYEDWYILPSGYQVASGASVKIQMIVSEPDVEIADVYWYYKAGNTYTKINNTDSEVPVSSGLTVGCEWNVTEIEFGDYNYPDTNGGKVLVGTTLEKKDFTITAKLMSGKRITLSPDKFTLDPTTDTVPREDKLTSHLVKFSYTRKDGETFRAEHYINVTQYEVAGFSAVCTKSKGYYVGDTIKESDFKLYEELRDVISGNNNGKSTEIKDSFSLVEGNTVATEGMTSVQIYCPGRGTTSAEITVYGIDRLTVDYRGKEVVVGQNLDTSKVTVSLWYKDGTSKKLSADDYTINPTVVSQIGVNEFTVTYEKGGVQPATFSVTGIDRIVSKLEAKYKGPDVIEGGTFLTTDLDVWAVYNDGSKEQVYDFLVSTTVLERKGANKITITYGGQSVTININGSEKLPNSIVAIYRGEPIIEGGMINTNDVAVTAYFNDGTNETVTDFSLSMNMLTTVGTNTVTVTYKKVTTTIFIVCMPRMVTALEVMYKGPEIVQGSSFNRDQVIVTATFNNGEVEQVTDFVLASTLVPNLGTNTYQITYGTMTANFQVTGIARTITGTGTMTVEMDNEDFEGVTLVALVDGQLIKEDMELEAEVYDPADLKKVVRKTTKKGKYFGFEMDVDGFEFDENQYMTAQIAIPDGFDASKVAVYYTPNRQSVMAKLGGGLVSSNVYEFYAYRSGTYVLLECDKQTLKEADLRGGGQMKSFIFVTGLKKTLKKGDKLNLTATLMYPESDKEPDFVWSVDDTSVAGITSKGVLTAKDSGMTEVTVKTKDEKVSYTFEIEVE